MLFKKYFSVLSPADMSFLELHSEQKSFQSGQTIYRSNTKVGGLHFLLSGLVKRHLLGHENKDHIYDIIGENEWFGISYNWNNSKYFDSATALSAGEYIFIPNRILVYLVKKYPSLNLIYISQLTEESKRHSQHSLVSAQYDLKQRMAYFLKYIHNKNTPSEFNVFELSRDDLASLLGTAKESAIRMLQTLKHLGAIQISGRKIVIVNMRLIEQCINDLRFINNRNV
jgi:CRP-like cAMP-binding protein